jgi:galactokinase
MTMRAQLAGRLTSAGCAAPDAETRAAMIDEAARTFSRSIGRPPRWAWFVPGRIEVFGKHTDYAGGRSLVAAVPRGFAMVAGPRSDGIVSAVDARWQVAMDVRPDGDARSFTGWANYVAVVARRLAANFSGATLGTNLVFSSDLPRAAGLSSSSALVVAVASALIRRAGLEERAEWRAALPTRLDLAGYLGAVENGLTFGALAGRSGVGTHGGSEDHTAILSCRADHVSAYAYVPVRHVGDAALPADWRFVVMASGIEADKAGSARMRYNRASLATRALVQFCERRGLAACGASLAAILSDDAAIARELARGLETSRDLTRPDVGPGEEAPEFDPDELRRRLAHFLAEDQRVPLAADAFRAGDAAALGALSEASQRDAEALLGNQIPETSALAALAREAGAFAASSFGAGFGGSVWALVPADEAPAFAERWRARYRAAYPGVADGACFIVRPGPATTEFTLEY